MVDRSHPSRGILLNLSESPQKLRHEIHQPALPISVLESGGASDSNNSTRPTAVYVDALESFVYILAWLLYGYSEGKAVADSPLHDWLEGTDDERAVRKRRWLKAPGRQKARQFDRLRKNWMIPLAKAVHEAQEKRASSAGESVIYDRFLAILES